MERDFNRYAVIKISHAEQALTREELRTIYKLGQKVYNWQRANDKPRFECVVIEHDWPEYEPVWEAIESRVDNIEPMSLCLISTKLLDDIPESKDADNSKNEYDKGWRNAEESIRNGFLPTLVKGISPYCQGWNDYMRPVMEF